jgi:threonine/homoserine/homoserine lactone efflux protein
LRRNQSGFLIRLYEDWKKCIDSLALAAGTAGEFLRRNRRFLRLQRWFAGTSFIGLGVTAALATRK